jgi:hypothetical protein
MSWLLFYYISKPPMAVKNKKVRLSAPKTAFLPLKNQWTALRVAHDCAASRRSCPNLVRLYNEVRTHFEQNV